MSLRVEVVDFAAVRLQHEDTRKGLAQRIFALWQPIFSHLDGQDYTFHLQRHVEDQSATQIRGIFGVDRQGKDRALIIVRVHEHLINGRIFARLTINAGCDPDYVQHRFGQEFVALEAWRYRLRHPLRPFFVVDGVVSAASYCVYEKTYSGFAPTAARPIPQEWWPLAEAGAEALGAQPVPGAQREVRRFPAVVRDTRPRRAGSERAKVAAAFFHEITQHDRELGVLVMVPLSFPRYCLTTARYAWVRLQRALQSGAARGR